MSLRLGKSFEGDAPANGAISGFRVGNRFLSEYSYTTLPIEAIDISYTDGSKDITVDEIKRFFDRTTVPEMTTGAIMFVPMTDDADYEHDYYTRPDEEHMVTAAAEGDIRSYGLGDIEDETVGMQFRIYQQDSFSAGGEHKAYFDNAQFKVSNILWEFSPDSGEESWYQMFDLPNRAYTRMTLPEATTRLRVRAISNSPDEWIQAFAIMPIPDMQERESS